MRHNNNLPQIIVRWQIKEITATAIQRDRDG